MTDRPTVDRWLSDYVAAWKSYDRDAIAALFSEDARYRYHPWNEPIRGRAAIVESWFGVGEGASALDAEGTYDGDYRTIAVDGDVAVATGTSTYVSEPGGPVTKVYENVMVMRFDQDGRCAESTEWFMKRPEPGG